MAEIANLNFELAPAPGTPVSERRKQLTGARFIAVRNMAYLIYKNPDQTPLMTWKDTLNNRDDVFNAVLRHEMGSTYQGQPILAHDGTPIPVATPTTPAVPAPQNGVQMSAPIQMPVPPPASPQQVATVPTAQYAPPMPQPMAPPQFAPQPPQPAPGFTPQPPAPMQMQVPVPPPVQAPVQQFAAPAPTPQAAPQVDEPKGRGRRRAATALPPAAPPAPSAPMAPQPMAPPQMFAPTNGVPPAGFQQAMPPAPMPPPPQQQFAPPPPPMAPAPVPTAAPAATVDLSPITQKLDNLGVGLTVAAKNGDDAITAVKSLAADLSGLSRTVSELLIALHHLYLQNPNLAQGKDLGQLQSFKAHLDQWLPK